MFWDESHETYFVLFSFTSVAYCIETNSPFSSHRWLRYPFKRPKDFFLSQTRSMYLTHMSLTLLPTGEKENIAGKLHAHRSVTQDWWHHCSASLVLRRFPHNAATMNFLRRRLSDSSFVANLPNGYMMDLQRPDNSTSSPVSPATERKHPQPLQPSHSSSTGTSIFSSISSAMKQTTQAAAGLIDHSASPTPPVAQKPKILLVIDDAHTDW